MQSELKALENINIGPQSARNLVVAQKLAAKMGPGHTIVSVVFEDQND